jgi:hypothetical protein
MHIVSSVVMGHRVVGAPLATPIAALMASVLMVWSCAAPAQAIWKYVDDKGVTHYTDQPVPGAEKIQLRSGNNSAATNSGSEPASAATRTAQQGAYRVFQIVRPADQDSVVNTGGALQVTMVLSPALQSEHTVSLYLDGKRVEDFPSNGLDHELQNVPRGEHTLVGVITDGSQRRVIETSKVTFTLRQKSVLMNPPVGPSVRPPSKAPTSPRAAPARSAQPSFADLKKRAG